MSAVKFSVPSAQGISTQAQPTVPSSLYSNPLLSLNFHPSSTTAQESQCIPILGCQCFDGLYRCTKKRDTIEPDLRQFASFDQTFSSVVQPTTTQLGKSKYELPFYPRTMNDEGSTSTGIMLLGSMTISSPSLYAARPPTFFSMTSSPFSSTLINSPNSTADGEFHSAGGSLDKLDMVAAIGVSITSFCLIVLLLILLRKRLLQTKKASAAQRQSKRMIDESELGFAAYEDHVGPQKME